MLGRREREAGGERGDRHNTLTLSTLVSDPGLAMSPSWNWLTSYGAKRPPAKPLPRLNGNETGRKRPGAVLLRCGERRSLSHRDRLTACSLLRDPQRRTFPVGPGWGPTSLCSSIKTRASPKIPPNVCCDVKRWPSLPPRKSTLMGSRASGFRELIISHGVLRISGHTLSPSALLPLANCSFLLLWELGFYTMSIFRSGAQWLLGPTTSAG